MAEIVSTATQVVKVRTRRGVLTIGPHGRIQGLWRIAERELRTNEQVRAMCAGQGRRGRPSTKPIDRHTLIKWRAQQDFPGPVLVITSSGLPLELWSRSEVEDWLAARRPSTPTSGS